MRRQIDKILLVSEKCYEENVMGEVGWGMLLVGRSRKNCLWKGHLNRDLHGKKQQLGEEVWRCIPMVEDLVP